MRSLSGDEALRLINAHGMSLIRKQRVFTKGQTWSCPFNAGLEQSAGFTRFFLQQSFSCSSGRVRLVCDDTVMAEPDEMQPRGVTQHSRPAALRQKSLH